MYFLKPILLLNTVLLVKFTTSVSNFNINTKMIVDLIKSYDKPTSVILNLCWESERVIRLQRALAKDNIPQSSTVKLNKDLKLLTLFKDSHSIMFINDVACPNSAAFLNFGSDNKLFRLPFRWLLIGLEFKESGGDQIVMLDDLYKHTILPDSEVIIFNKESNVVVDFYFIYTPCPGKDWRSERFGYWHENFGFFNDPNTIRDPAALRRKNLEKCEIKISYVLTHNDSINHLDDHINDHIDTITKSNFHTTNYLLEYLNASTKFIFTETWGYKINGSWNGMTGYLVRNQVEIGGSPMYFTAQRIPVVEYILRPTQTLSKFVFQQPKLSTEKNLFLLSFSATVWYCTVALIVTFFIAIFIVSLWEWNSSSDSKIESSASVLRPNFSDIVILVFGAACQQGSPVELKGLLGRAVMLLLFLTIIFMYTSYTANIVALLQSSSTQIETLEDLLNSKMKFGVHDTVYNRYYFETATEPIRKAIYETKVAPYGEKPRFMTMEEGIKKMQKGLFAFHMAIGVGYKFVGKYFLEGEKCGLKELQFLQNDDPWLAIKKNSPYREMLKIGTKRLSENGIQSRQNNLYYEERPKCSDGGSSFISVSMVDCYSALLVLTYGTVVALTVLALEIVIHRRQHIIVKLRKTKTQNPDSL